MPDFAKRVAPSSSPNAKLGTATSVVLSVESSPQDDSTQYTGGTAETNSAAFCALMRTVTARSERRSDGLWPGFLIAQLGV